MAGVKISELPVATTPLTGAELVPIVQGGVTDQVTVANLIAGAVTPAAGSNTQVQYNNSGSFAGSANLTFNGTTLTAAALAGPHNGTVGATTPNTGAFTTLSATPAVNTTPLNISGYSLTGTNAQSLLDLSGTWNTTGTPTALKLNVTDTASNASSLLLDLQVGGATKFNIAKDGAVNLYTTAVIQGNFALTNSNNTARLGYNGSSAVNGLFVSSTSEISFANGVNANLTLDTRLFRDAANTLAQRNGVNAQTSRIYNTFTDASNYERGKIAWASNVLQIGTEKAGTGTARALDLQTDGTTRLSIGTTGSITSSDLADAVGYKGTPLNEQSAAYTLVLADQGKSITHPASDNNARTFTIPANSVVAFPVGTTITFINMINTVTISINTDTLYLAGSGATGSRTLAAYGVATAIKVAATTWMISGSNLS